MMTEHQHQIARKPIPDSFVSYNTTYTGHNVAATSGLPPVKWRVNAPVDDSAPQDARGLDQTGSLLPNEHRPDSDTVNDEKKYGKSQGSFPGKHTRPQRRHQIPGRTWLWECLSCVAVVSLACAMVAVLAVYNTKPLPQLPLSISLNAVISLLAIALKAALIIPIAACKRFPPKEIKDLTQKQVFRS